VRIRSRSIVRPRYLAAFIHLGANVIYKNSAPRPPYLSCPFQTARSISRPRRLWVFFRNYRTTITAVAPRGHIDEPGNASLPFMRISHTLPSRCLTWRARALFQPGSESSSTIAAKNRALISTLRDLQLIGGPTCVHQLYIHAIRFPYIICIFAIKTTNSGQSRPRVSERSREDLIETPSSTSAPSSADFRIYWCAMSFRKTEQKNPDRS